MRIVSILLLSFSLLPAALYAQKTYTIAEIQGAGNTSPHSGETVTISGVVTALTRTGFFLQTSDDKSDANPATSEGIFVFTKTPVGGSVAVGNNVEVSGEVQEYRPRNDTSSLTTTELSHRLGQDNLKVISAQGVLPKPVVITAADFAPNTVDELEKYDGLPVSVAEVTVVGPPCGLININSSS